MTKYHHIVLFKLQDDVSDKNRAKAVAMLRDLGNGHLGLEDWKINESIDKRKGYIITEEALFYSEEAYQAFRTSSKHVMVGDFMKAIADWWVGDYLA